MVLFQKILSKLVDSRYSFQEVPTEVDVVGFDETYKDLFLRDYVTKKWYSTKKYDVVFDKGDYRVVWYVYRRVDESLPDGEVAPSNGYYVGFEEPIVVDFEELKEFNKIVLKKKLGY